MAGGVSVGSCAHVGIGVSLIPQIVVGGHTVVGAGACVVRDLPDYVVAVGIPAKVIKKISRKG
ncbi:putative acetyltransferase EpsM [compost metagenome]